MIKVNWDENVCEHAGVCVNSLPSVFAIVDGKFTVNPEGASDDEIRAVVDKCPSGALSVDE